MKMFSTPEPQWRTWRNAATNHREVVHLNFRSHARAWMRDRRPYNVKAVPRQKAGYIMVLSESPIKQVGKQLQIIQWRWLQLQLTDTRLWNSSSGTNGHTNRVSSLTFTIDRPASYETLRSVSQRVSNLYKTEAPAPKHRKQIRLKSVNW